MNKIKLHRSELLLRGRVVTLRIMDSTPLDRFSILPHRQQTAYSMMSSLGGRHLKGKGKRLWMWEKCEECTRKEGGISTFTWWMFIMHKTIVSWQAFPSLLPSCFFCTKNPLSLPFEMPATQAKWCHSICLPVYTVNIYIYISSNWSCLMSVVLQFRTIRSSTVAIDDQWLLLKPELL